MTYATAHALRMALEQRLLNQSRETGISLDRLRRRVVFERIVARLRLAEPGHWVLKGGMALEVRLRDAARLTKDIDLGLRTDDVSPMELHERLVEALRKDPCGDRFLFTPGTVVALAEDGLGHPTLRSRVTGYLAGKHFGAVQIDVSPREHELVQTETVGLPNSLAFADIEAPDIEIIDVHRHAAEKLHAMLRRFGDRENTRVRDLVDLVILREQDQLSAGRLHCAVEDVWREREGTAPPIRFTTPPATWAERYERIARDNLVTTTSYSEAIELVSALWKRASTAGPHPLGDERA